MKRWFLPVGVLFLLVSAVVAEPGKTVEPNLTPPESLRILREFSMEGPVLERLKESRPGLRNVEYVSVRSYAYTTTKKKRPGKDVFEHFRNQLEAQGWFSLLKDESRWRRAIVYSSPDGNWLFAVTRGSRGIVTSLVKGNVDLAQIPELERAIMHRLAPGMRGERPEETEVIRHYRHLLRQGKTDEAESVLREAIKQNPQSVGLRIELAEIMRKGGRPDVQLSLLKEAVALDPTGYFPRVLLARALYDQKKDLKSAEYEFLQAASLDPFKGTPRYFLGRIYEDSGRLTEALKQYELAEELGDRWLSVPLRVGAIYERMGDKKKAADAYKRALEISPKSTDAQEGLRRVSGGIN